jgi:peptidoglycan/LPS O-acetylase OafA/YrhL
VVLVAIAGWPQEGMPRAIWDVLCMLVVFPLVVLWGTRVDPGERLRRVATFLGVTSYAVYVLHTPVLSVMNSATPFLVDRLGSSIEAPRLAIAVVVGLLAGAWLVDRYFDMPVRRLLGKLIPRVRTARVAQTKR